MNPRDVRSDLYGYDRMSTAHLYAVPVLKGLDAIRNCSHCSRNTDDNCKAWREARGAVAVLTQEARLLVKGVDELRDATGGRTANIYQFSCGSVAYFAPDAPDFQEAGELKGDDLDKALRVLDATGERSEVMRAGRKLGSSRLTDLKQPFRAKISKLSPRISRRRGP